MKKKLFSLLVLLMAAVTGAWADIIPTYDLSVGENAQGTVKFYVGETEVTKAAEGATVTVVITPNTGWVVNQTSGQWYAAIGSAKAPRRAAGIGLLQDIDLGDGSTDQTTGAVTYSFTMERANAVISAAYKKLLTHADISITAPNQVFNGQDLQPVVTVKDGSTTLVKNKDYTLNIPECINVGEYAVVVTGKGFYTGMTSVTYKVTGRPINTLMISEVKPLTYTGKQHRPLVTVSFGETTLVKDQDYYLGYTNNINAGTAKMSIMGLGNYTGYAFLEFDITKAPLTVKVDDAQVICGKEAPQYEVSYEGFVAEETKDVLEGTLTITCDYTKESAVGSTFAITPSGLTSDNYDIIFVDGTLTVVADQNAPYKETLQTAIAIASNINPEALADAIAAAQAAMTAEDATAESLTQANQTLETAIKAYLGEILPGLGAIVEGLNDETLNAAYADAEAALAKEDVTLQELVAAMQQIIAAAQDVAPEHLQNLKGYAVKYGAEDAATLIDAALEAIESGNVSQIIATMTAVKEAATPLAEQVLGTMINYVQAFGLTEQAAQAQAALESGNYITMITTAKELFSHLIAAAKEYLPKLGAIAEGLNDETLNSAYAAAQALLAKESITPEELGAAMQQIIAAAQDVAPEHLQNLKEYAVKYGAEDAATLIDAALEAIESGNVSQIIATMTAVKEAATPLATAILTQMIEKAQSYTGFEEDITEAQAALESGNYITMITAAKALYAKLQAADQAAADAVIALIEAIGDVEYTPESKALIDAARNAYSELTEDQKALVTNYEVLTTAETTYANLKAAAEKAAADKAAADDVIAKINAIGEVAYTEACKNLIDAARNAYDALTADQKALVTNLKVLTDAETKYAELEAIATGISTIKAIAGKTIYDMNGRKVTVPSKKGMYIINGRKVVIK